MAIEHASADIAFAQLNKPMVTRLLSRAGLHYEYSLPSQPEHNCRQRKSSGSIAIPASTAFALSQSTSAALAPGSDCKSGGDINYKEWQWHVTTLIRPAFCFVPLSLSRPHNAAGSRRFVAQARPPACKRLPQQRSDIVVPRQAPNNKKR